MTFKYTIPDYAIVSIRNEFLVLEDAGIGESCSITNGVDTLLTELNKEYDVSAFKVIYKDSDGIFDGIKVKSDGTFDRFLALRKVDMYEAIAEYEKRYAV